MEIRTVSFQKHKRMSLVQFFSSDKDSVAYISGPSALQNDLIKVKEISQSGSVNDLLVYNLSEKYVFFMDGDILTGAKQNRVLNTSVLLAPNSKVTLPVSCVEQGRWDSYFSDFKSSDYIAPQKLRANKAQAVKESRELRKIPHSRQSEVWDDVQNYSMLYQCDSATMSLNDVYEKKRVDFDSFIKHFKINNDANGMAVFSDNHLLCTDLFNSSDVYKEYFPKLLRSVSMELVHLKDKKNAITETEAVYKTVSMYDYLSNIDASVHQGVGVGSEKRFEDKSVTGLSLEFSSHIIHLTALNIEGGKKVDHRRTRVY